MEDEWSTGAHHHLVLVQRYNRVINTRRCRDACDGSSFRAVIHPGDAATTDRPGWAEQAAISGGRDGLVL